MTNRPPSADSPDNGSPRAAGTETRATLATRRSRADSYDEAAQSMVHSSKTRDAKADYLVNLRRGELKRILRHRGVSGTELANQIEDILAERERWSAAELGKRTGLAFEEKLSQGIRTIQCVDKCAEDVRAYFRERKRTRDRLRQAKKRRMKQEQADSMSVRARQLYLVLDDVWRPTTDLAEAIKKRGQFRGAKRRRLKTPALRQALQRAVRELCKLGRAEEIFELGQHRERVRKARRRR